MISEHFTCRAQPLIASALSILLVTQAWGVDLARSVRVYLYRPDVFADRYLGLGLPADRSILQSNFWYLRPAESERAQAGREAFAGFVRSNQVSGLDLNGHRTFTNGDLEILFTDPAVAVHFHLLKLKGTLTNDRAVATVGRLHRLQVLELSERVSDKGLPFLKSLKQLQALTLPGAGVTDQALEILAELPRLRILDLKNTAVSDKDLSRLARLPLRHLAMGPKVTDAGLAALAGLRTLEQLDLQQSQVTRNGLASLAALPLHTLFLGPSFSDGDAAILPDFKNLKRLDLSGARLSDTSLSVFSQMMQLEELALTDTQVTGQTLKALSQIPKLRYLEISGTRITPAAFELFSRQSMVGFPALEVISFSSTEKLTKKQIKLLAALPRLHSIVINGVPLGRRAVMSLREPQTRRLQWIAIAEAAEPAGKENVDEVLELASARGYSESGRSGGVRGLAMIHTTESSLEEVVPAVSAPVIEVNTDTEQNFLGEFTINSGSSKKKKSKGQERTTP